MEKTISLVTSQIIADIKVTQRRVFDRLMCGLKTLDVS